MTFIVFLFIFLGLLVRTFLFRSVLFFDWDEGIYAQIAQEIIKNKSLVATFNGQIWLDKPPLANALIAMMFSIFGRPELSGRLLITIFSITLLVLLYFLAKKVVNVLLKTRLNKMPAWERQLTYLLPVFFLSSSSLYIERSTILNTDIMLAVGWVGYFLFVNNFSLKLLFLNIGVLNKSLLGFYPALFELLTITRKSLNKKAIGKAFILVAVSSLWYIYGYLKFGNEFFTIHFYKQMIKRLAVPIELHFGDKFYYLQNLWGFIGPLIFIVALAYLIIANDILREIFKKKFEIIKTKRWWSYLILLSPLPFFLFLTVGRSKLFWYLTMILPFFALICSYLYARISNKFIRWALAAFIVVFFIYKFVPSTYLLTQKYSPPDRLILAQCLSKQPGTKLSFLVNEDERKIQNFLEAAHYETNSSFLYGGSPSFVYYVKKHVDYFYNIDAFSQNLDKYNLVVLSKKDFNSNVNLKQNFLKLYKPICSTNDWQAFVK